MTLQSKLQKLQNRAARVITGDSWEIRSKDILSKLHWQPLNRLRLERMLLLMRKILRNEAPKAITDHFQLSVNSQYNLRSNHNMLMLSKPRTNAMKRSFSYHAAKTWNYLPTELKDLMITDSTFKHHLRDYINVNESFLANYVSY